MLLGHEKVVEALSSQLPSVFIITGPSSVGKRLIATHAAIENKINRLDFTEVTQLTVSESLRVKEFIATKPFINNKYVLIDLDNATKPASDKLLKLLEQPPEYATFALISSQQPLRAIAARAEKYSVGLLASEDLKQILQSHGIPAHEAGKLAHYGRVDKALEKYHNSHCINTALTVLQAVSSGDYVLFLQAFKAVDEKVATTLVEILQECFSQKYRLYSLKDLGVFSKREVAAKVLNTWSSLNQARPVIAIKIALESLMKGY